MPFDPADPSTWLDPAQGDSANAGPLDLSGVSAPAPSPVQGQIPPRAPAPPAPPRNRRSALAQAALMALIPIAAKRGGQPAVTALLSGFQQAQQAQAQQAQQAQAQAQQAQAQQAHLAAADQQAQAVLDQRTRAQAAALDQQTHVAQAALVKDFAGKLAVAGTQEDIDALAQAFRAAAPIVGVRPETVESIVSGSAPTPPALIARQVRKAVSALTPAQVETYLRGNMALTVPGQDRPIPVEAWAPYLTSGMTADGTRTVGVRAPVLSLEDRWLAAMQRGDHAEAARLQQAANLRDAPRTSPTSPSGGAPKTAAPASDVDGMADLAARQPAVLQSFTPTMSGRIIQAISANPDRLRTFEATRLAPIRASATRLLHALSDLVGPNAQGQMTLTPGAAELYGIGPGRIGSWIPGSTGANARAALGQVTGNLVLSLLAEAKAQSKTGATGFGQLSERELSVIENAATMLKGELSDDRALRELVNLYESTKKIMAPGPGESMSGGSPIVVTAPDGSTHPFATQADADRFKQLAGIR